MAAQTITDVRPSPIVGRWYDSNKKRLANSIDQMLEDAPSIVVDERITGLVVPHAGHRYSGWVAARAFRGVKGADYERVVIISPMHHPYSGVVLTTDHDGYETPIGVVPVDREFISELSKFIDLHPVRRDPEHAVEIELPFLQQALVSSFMLVPLMLRDQGWATAKKLGEALATVIGQLEGHTLLVASSDLSHFYYDDRARELDRLILDRVEAFDPAGVVRLEDEGKAFACGRGAIASVLAAARSLGAEIAQVVGYGTSADVGGDKTRVVGYGAAVIY